MSAVSAGFEVIQGSHPWIFVECARSPELLEHTRGSIDISLENSCSQSRIVHVHDIHHSEYFPGWLSEQTNPPSVIHECV